MVTCKDYNVGGRCDDNSRDGLMTFTFMEQTTNSTPWAFRHFE